MNDNLTMKNFIKDFDESKLKEVFEIKKAYNAGDISLELANAQLKAHIGSIKPVELAYIEQHMQEFVDDECIVEDIKEMLAIYQDVLEEKPLSLPEGHPIDNYIKENEAIRMVIATIEKKAEKPYIKNEWDELIENLNQFKIHLSRKQNQLYSLLEKKGFDRPTTTMWLFDNAVRDKITALSEKVAGEFDWTHVKAEFEEFKEYILDLMDKEETILYPTSLEMISVAEFLEMTEGDKEIGYCLITPNKDFQEKYAKTPSEKVLEVEKEVRSDSLKTPSIPSSQEADFATELGALLEKYKKNEWNEDTPMNVKQGLLSLNQINLLFQNLPVDISYVDENELVAFYSDTKHRVFPRSKGVIGRDVKNCHPKNSVHVVEEIIEKFRSGEQDKVEFWINKPNLFIYIVYVAIRDENGRFRGVMEMMQDCTAIRAMQGSRTLLQWENERKEEEPIATETEADNRQDAQLVEAPVNSGITQLENTTKLVEVFNQYPDFKEYMINSCDKFKMLNSPLFKVVGKVATVEMASERSGMSIDEIKKLFQDFLTSRENG